MKDNNKLIPENANFYLKKRGIVETVIGHLKDFKHLVRAKYRSVTNFFMNIFFRSFLSIGRT